MNFIDDPQIIVPVEIQPVYLQEEAKFGFQLKVVNQHEHPIHFYIGSTFGCCLTESTKVRRIEEKSNATLVFRLTMTNLVGGGMEAVAIYAAQHSLYEQFPLGTGTMKLIKLSFEEDIKIDPAILDILKQEVALCLEAAQNYKITGNKAQAIRKYEQAYQILRKQERTVNSLIDIRIQENDFVGAMQDIQSMLIHAVANPHYLLKKMRVIMLWQQGQVAQNQELFHYVKTTLDFLKENQFFLDKQNQQVLQGLRQDLKKYAKTSKGQPNKMLQMLYAKSVQKYSEDLPISKFYKSKEQFQQQLKEILMKPDHEDMATPEQVLDPISYCIMKQPFIVPSGNSIEWESLASYFMTNGNKDPITRQLLNPKNVYPNNAFQKYIREHPKRKQWEKYEYDYINN